MKKKTRMQVIKAMSVLEQKYNATLSILAKVLEAQNGTVILPKEILQTPLIGFPAHHPLPDGSLEICLMQTKETPLDKIALTKPPMQNNMLVK